MSHCKSQGLRKSSGPHANRAEMEVFSEGNLQGAHETPCLEGSVLKHHPRKTPLARQQWYLPLSVPFPLTFLPLGPILESSKSCSLNWWKKRRLSMKEKKDSASSFPLQAPSSGPSKRERRC